MDRLADIRSAVRSPDCVLQRAMDQVGECSTSIRPSLEQMLMWSKGSETLQAIANGMDALLERRLEDAERELADMDAQNSFASTSVREAAQSILGAGRCCGIFSTLLSLTLLLSARESSQQMDSPIRHTINTMWVAPIEVNCIITNKPSFSYYKDKNCSRKWSRRRSVSAASGIEYAAVSRIQLPPLFFCFLIVCVPGNAIR
jgi:hypothetical protein